MLIYIALSMHPHNAFPNQAWICKENQIIAHYPLSNLKPPETVIKQKYNMLM